MRFSSARWNAQAIGQSAIQQGHRVLYRETQVLLDQLADAVAEGIRKEFMEWLATVPLLIIDDFGMRKLPATAAEDLLEIIMRRYERTSTLLTSNRPVEDWGKLLGDVAAVTAMLDSDFASRACAEMRPEELAHESGGEHGRRCGMRNNAALIRGSAPNPTGASPLRPQSQNLLRRRIALSFAQSIQRSATYGQSLRMHGLRPCRRSANPGNRYPHLQSR